MRDYHPWVTVSYYAAIIGLSMFSDSPFFLLISFLGGAVYALYIKKNPEERKKALKNIIGISFIVLIIGTLMNGLFTHNGATVLFFIGPNRITLEAFIYGTIMALMIITVITWFISFGEVMTSDKLIDVFGKMAPVIGLTISMVFRFVPLLKRRYEEIRLGQVSLGRDNPKGFLEKIKQKTKEISILISWSLEASIESADSMAARGYGLPGRTSYRIFKFDNRDGLTIAFILMLTITIGFAYYKNLWRIYYYPEIRMSEGETGLLSIIVLPLFALLAFLPLITELYGDFKWKKYA